MVTSTGLVGLKPGAERFAREPAKKSSSFIDGVMALLERTEYRRCESGEDREEIFHLRYRSYRAHGFVPETEQQIVKDDLDDLPNCYNFAVYIDKRLVSTVRLHQIDRENPLGPVTKGFGDVMSPLIEQGDSCINPSMLAADPDLAREYRALPYVSLRLVIAAYEYFRSTYCACLIRQEHTAFYRRIFGARQMSPERAYPPISIPLMLFGGVCAREFGPIVERFPFFLSTRSEQRMLFERTASGISAPLTILPTAKYLQHAA
ncbi:hypothetical protein T8J41_10275 [Nitratireductor rhodophyticola]|uniref:N-acyl amino acid synthase FeeM domain-containing protein n=1 Tax=Nitratireductor rhodophyticola TaxID=2854036 RepID=UPI002AC91D58|nr:hypothetical protein [Nitratireductor rhodophyticola]WPZ12572.1 hypothetical protein T8J41_10275 [Nitratireductor rhodophyticola]